MANIIFLLAMAILMVISFVIEAIAGEKWALIFLGVYISAEVTCVSAYVIAYLKEKV